jgi:hypothetical protein
MKGEHTNLLCPAVTLIAVGETPGGSIDDTDH